MAYSIPRDILDSAPPVFSYEFDGTISYVKKNQKRVRKFGHRALEFAWRLTGNPLLTPSMLKDDENAARFEAKMLETLEKEGIRAPRLLYVCDDYFVMSSVGDNLEHVFNRSGPVERQMLIAKAVKALRALHDKNLAWGGAQIRNFALMDGDVYVFDFEERIPPEHIEIFKLRDLLIFIFSLERKGHNPDVKEICRIYDQGDAGHSHERLRALFSRIYGLGLLRWLFDRFKKMRDPKAFLNLIRKIRSA